MCGVVGLKGCIQSVRVVCIEGTVSINCKGGFHPSIGDSSLLCYKHHVRYADKGTTDEISLTQSNDCSAHENSMHKAGVGFA